MAKINLLPWRADRRDRRKREFFTHLAIAGVAAVVLVLLWGFWVSMRVSNQNGRNDYLKAQIQQLDAKIAEIKNLQQVKDHLLARKRIVEKLQSSRSQMVHLFDQIAKTIPAGARLTSMKQQGDTLTLDGVAQSYATVADYMSNIEASPWLGPARLVKAENVHANTNTPYVFELVVTLETPKPDKDGAVPASGSTAAGTAVAGTAAATAAPKTASTTAPAPAPVPVPVPVPAATATSAARASASAAPPPPPATNEASAKAKVPAAATASTSKGGRP